MTNISTLDYVENFSISKSISDTLWRLNITIDKEDAPAPLVGIRAFATDHASVEHCLFIGFIPGAEYVRKIEDNKVSITAYDYSWYLTTQHVARSELNLDVRAETIFHHVYTMMGGNNSLNVTGLSLCSVPDIEQTCTYPGTYNWNPETSKMDAIGDICTHCDKVWWVRFNGTETCVTLVSPGSIDSYLPAQVIFTSPSNYVIDIGINVQSIERYNRINVYGTDPNTGDWYSKTEETAAVTAEEEKPIDYSYEDAKLGTQAKVDAKAAALYNELQTISPDTYSATLTNRYDLELMQKVKFVGYSNIPEIDMRIISITYQRVLNANRVLITFTQDRPFSEVAIWAQVAESDVIQTQQQVIQEEIQSIANLSLATVTDISGNIATLTLERSGNEITARILV